MDALSRIANWLSDHEATISAVAALTVLVGVLPVGLPVLLRRRAEPTSEITPGKDHLEYSLNS